MANLGLVVVSSILTLAAAEAAVRYLGVGIDSGERRALMFSSQTFQACEDGGVHYIPEKTIGAAAVYGGKIEYRVRFRTNNMGFIDNQDYGDGSAGDGEHYAFVGDSFTAGFHGGEPWVPRLRDEVSSGERRIYNLGVGGTSVDHFPRILECVKDELRFDHIVVVAISNDFERRLWYPLTNESEIRFCRPGWSRSRCLERPPVATIFDLSWSNGELLDMAEHMDAGRTERSGGVKEILKRSKFLVWLVRALRQAVYNREPEYSLGFLERISEAFPSAKVYFVHLPQKEEVLSGEYRLKGLGRKMESIDVRYFPALKACKWSEAMFFDKDAHPNKIGYRNIARCVRRYLFEAGLGLEVGAAPNAGGVSGSTGA